MADHSSSVDGVPVRDVVGYWTSWSMDWFKENLLEIDGFLMIFIPQVFLWIVLSSNSRSWFVVCFQGPILLPWDNRCAWKCVLWGYHMPYAQSTHSFRCFTHIFWAESPIIIEYIPVGHGLSLYGSYIANIPQSVSDQVGLLYAVQNLLYFACLQYTSAAAYQVMSSSELVMWPCCGSFLTMKTDVQEGTLMEKGAYIVWTCFKWALTAHISVYRCTKL